MALAVGIIYVPRVYNILTQSKQTDGRYNGSGSYYGHVGRYNLYTHGLQHPEAEDTKRYIISDLYV